MFELHSEETNEILNYLASVESSARTYASDISSVIERGKSLKVVDTDGNVYIDCLAGAETLALGHNNLLMQSEKFGSILNVGVSSFTNWKYLSIFL